MASASGDGRPSSSDRQQFRLSLNVTEPAAIDLATTTRLYDFLTPEAVTASAASSSEKHCIAANKNKELLMRLEVAISLNQRPPLFFRSKRYVSLIVLDLEG